jgi:hypothetical protein
MVLDDNWSFHEPGSRQWDKGRAGDVHDVGSSNQF